MPSRLTSNIAGFNRPNPQMPQLHRYHVSPPRVQDPRVREVKNAK